MDVNNTLSDLRQYLAKETIGIRLPDNSWDISRISKLWVSSLSEDQAGLLSKHCKELTSLKVYGQIDEKTMNKIGTIVSLIKLDINLLHQDYILCLKNLKNLTHLNIANAYQRLDTLYMTNILKFLPQLQFLGTLFTMNNQVIAILAKFKQLKGLKMKQPGMKLSMLSDLLSNVPQLTSITFQACNIYDQKLRIMNQELKNLQQINLYCNDVSDKGLVYLNQYQQTLKKLDIRRNERISQQGVLSIFKQFKCLVKLSIFAKSLTDLLLQNLPIQLPNLEVLEISGDHSNLSYTCLDQMLQKLSNLKTLKLQSFYDDKLSKTISQSLKKLNELQLVRVYFKTTMTDSGRFYLSRLNRLRHIDTTGNDGNVGYLKILKNIKRVFYKDLTEQIVASDVNLSTYLSRKKKKNLYIAGLINRTAINS